MESKINLLPEKDKQLKREIRAPKDVVEMSTPQDRVFQERVIRMGGVLAFIKTLFKRKPSPLPKTKQVIHTVPPTVPIPAPKPSIPTGPVTRLQTMPERFAPKAPAAPAAPSFLSRIFSRSKVSKLPFPSRPSPTLVKPVVPLPPKPLVPAQHVVPPPAPLAPVPPPPVRRQAWSPPVPGTAPTPPAPVMPAWKQKVDVPPQKPHGFIPPVPVQRQVGSLSEVTPILGAGLNVNLVPVEYQPEAPARDRLIALIAVGAAILLVVGTTVGLSLYRKSLDQKINDLVTKTSALSQQISSLETGPLQQANVLRQRTADVTKALDQHVYWDTFFSELESVTLPTVAYTTMSADVAGSVTMSATATSFDEVGKQLLTYQKATNFITQATILSATKVSGGTTEAAPGQTPQSAKELAAFTVSLRVTPQTFYHTK